jgi:predicted RNA-binding protein (virulence factor B family)
MKIGKINSLRVTHKDDTGFFLTDTNNNEVFLAASDYTEGIQEGDNQDVFVYKNIDNQVRASLTRPFIQLDEFAFLTVNEISPEGAFMDWGLPDDLWVPPNLQRTQMHTGESYLVFLFVDEDSGIIKGSCLTDENVFYDDIDVEVGEEVDLLLYGMSDLGMNVIVNNLYKGLIFNSDIHQKLKRNMRMKGYVKNIREDGKLDITIKPQGYRKVIGLDSNKILQVLKENGDYVEITDQSSPHEINQMFGLSKKAFKKALGNLFKRELVDLYEDGIGIKQKR